MIWVSQYSRHAMTLQSVTYRINRCAVRLNPTAGLENFVKLFYLPATPVPHYPLWGLGHRADGHVR